MSITQSLPRRQAMLAAIAFGVATRTARAVETDPWPDLVKEIFDDRPIADGIGLLALDAPTRATDAALVPITLRRLPPAGDRIHSITVVIDQNPSPLAARFVLGESGGIGNIATRIRVDSYTNIHAVAELPDGRLAAVTRFVKAAGGCSAPAASQDADPTPLGTMRFRQLTSPAHPDRREAELIISHPNHSGMQMDPISRLYVPAHFVSSFTIWQGDDLLLGVETGISISENPEFRFDYRANGAPAIRAQVTDNQGGTFSQAWPVPRV